MNEPIYIKLFLGFSAPIAGVLVSLSTHLPDLQVISVCIGGCVGLVALANGMIDLYRKIKK